MTYEEKRKFLSKYRDYVLICKETKKQIVELREMQLPSSPKLDGMPKNPNHEDHMARYAGQFAELVDEYDKALANVVEIHRAINALDDPREQYVLSACYISGKHNWELQEELNYSERQFLRIKKGAIEKLRIERRNDGRELGV